MRPFEIGENKTLAMKIITGINRMPITEQTVAAIKEIATVQCHRIQILLFFFHTSSIN